VLVPWLDKIADMIEIRLLTARFTSSIIFCEVFYIEIDGLYNHRPRHGHPELFSAFLSDFALLAMVSLLPCPKLVVTLFVAISSIVGL
jgi:hypothetical protein